MDNKRKILEDIEKEVQDMVDLIEKKFHFGFCDKKFYSTFLLLASLGENIEDEEEKDEYATLVAAALAALEKVYREIISKNKNKKS